jgi:hypothetical protein
MCFYTPIQTGRASNHHSRGKGPMRYGAGAALGLAPLLTLYWYFFRLVTL